MRAPLDSFGANARRARERLGLRQADVAERSDISVEVYGNIERGKALPRLTTLMRLCEVLRVQPNDLLVGSDPQPVRRNEGISAEQRQLLSVVGDDSAKIKLLTDIARLLRDARIPGRGSR